MSDRADNPPPLDGILETALYVDDLEDAVAFYHSLFAFPVLFSDARMTAFMTGDDRVLLLFRRGASAAPTDIPGGTIPPHDGSGPVHIAFAIADANFPAWERRLADCGVEIESRTDWPRGHSIYFRDPDGHLLELASRRLWARD